MLLLWLGHAADVLDVLAAWQMCMGLVGAMMWWASSLSCYFTSFFVSGITMLLRSLFFCLLCLTLPTKGLTDRQTNGRHGCICLVPLGNQARNRSILGTLGEICGFQAFTSLKTDTHWSCWSCISLQYLLLSRNESCVFQPLQHSIMVVTALANCKAKQAY